MNNTAQFPPGSMLDDKYRIDQLLSVGGMGAVYAIKVLRTELAGALHMVERFQREAVAASAIGHENIVAVTDMGTTSWPSWSWSCSPGETSMSGDFTIDLWAKITEPPEFQSTMLANWECSAQGGINLSPNQDNTMFVGAFHHQTGTDLCMAGGETLSGVRSTDGGWHFYRLVRDTTAGTLALCIDGVHQGSTGEPAADMSSGQPLYVGRNVEFNPPYFDGQVDDLRVLKRALPCE